MAYKRAMSCLKLNDVPRQQIVFETESQNNM